MVREGYKEVQLLGKNLMIPNEWEINKLNDYIDVLSGYSFSSDKFNKEGDGLPLIRIRDLQESEISTYFNGEYDEKYIIDRNDILIGMDGNFYVEKWDNNKALLNQRVCRVESKSEELDQNYLYYRIKPEIDKIHRITPATTVKHLSIKDVKKTRIPFPPLSEQKKIASILSSVDKSIEKTDEVIEETKELKKGLMQELLTKGIGHSEFKVVRIANKTYKLPKEWNMKTMNEICEKVTDGTHDTPKTVNNGFPFITAKDITNGKLDFSNCSYITEKEHKKIMKRSKPEYGDILMINIGATVGRVVSVDVKQEFSIKNVALFKPTDKLIYNKFLFYMLKGIIVQNFLQIILQGGVQPYLSLKVLRNLDIPIPSLEEQKKIASILSSVDAKIKKEEEYKAKLERLKKGLMQKLLTGEIRVNTEMEV